MPLKRVTFEVTDGEYSYNQYEYVMALTDDEAIDRAIKQRCLNNKKMYNIEAKDKTGRPCRWLTKDGYNGFQLSEVSDAILSVIGLHSPLYLNELMGRPILPLWSHRADWIWSHRNGREYWWYQGDIIIACNISNEPSQNIHIFNISYWDKDKIINAKLENEWTLDKEKGDE
jgi:hypothetical protein